MGATPITDKEKKIILELFNKGYNRIQISKEINRHPSSVSNYIKSLGMQFSLNTYDKKITEEEIKKKMIKMYINRNSCATIKSVLNLKISENTMVKILKDINRTYFGFYGNNQIVSEIKELLRQELNISDNKIADKGTVSQISFSKKDDILNFYNYIYKDCTIWMKRKKEIFRTYIENNSK